VLLKSYLLTYLANANELDIRSQTN